MRDYPYFRFYLTDAMRDTRRMNQQEKAEYFDNLIDSWMDCNMDLMPIWLKSQVSKIEDISAQRAKASRSRWDKKDSRERKSLDETSTSDPRSIDEKPKTEEKESKPDPLLDPNSIESRFEEARKQFPGRKLGFAVEFQNFVKKVGGRSKAAAEVDRLLPGINAEKADREAKAAAQAFIPEWKNFKTWISSKAWEQEFATTLKVVSTRQTNREAKLRSGFALAAKINESAGISAPVHPLEEEK